MRIILASASPRRKEILENIGLKFEIIVSQEEESINKNIPCELYVSETAMLKANAVAKRLNKDEDTIIISADTIVHYNGKILEKPKDESDAKQMLKSLSGNTHQVYTGICVMRLSDLKTVTKSVKTDVTFKEITDLQIDNYIKCGEYKDKAGSYAIQNKGALLTEKIDGDYYNVVGLPVSALADVLYDEFGIDII